MKTILSILSIGLFCAMADAQNSSTSTVPPSTGATVPSMESTGTVTEYTPDSSLVLDTGSGEPVHFVFGRNVTYVGSDGQPVQASGLRKNLRVRVHYVKSGGDNVIDKVTLTE
ncbi:MAG TPA: hypothetical protein VGH08_08180 [Chthoniobacterales bacterium]|jgi:hypothetical protein